MIRAGLLLLCLCGAPAWALDLKLPVTARQTVERNTAPDLYAVPVAAFDGERVPTVALEGDIRRSAWRISSPGLTPLQVMRPLRDQLRDAGFDILLDCDSASCGGFDFRFAAEVLPGPNMYVNLRSYQFVTAVKGGSAAPREAVTVLASSTATSAYVQIIHALTDGADTATLTVERTAPLPLPSSPSVPGSISELLLGQGHAVLGDLDFDSGSTDLGAGPFASLQALAAFLEAEPDRRVALVGHTDTVGGLAPNIAISRARAQSVRARLIDQFGVSPDRLDAEGMGYLAPLASNLDDRGRDANRRVEAVLLTE